MNLHDRLFIHAEGETAGQSALYLRYQKTRFSHTIIVKLGRQPSDKFCCLKGVFKKNGVQSYISYKLEKMQKRGRGGKCFFQLSQRG
jgi:hypothetical protein